MPEPEPIAPTKKARVERGSGNRLELEQTIPSGVTGVNENNGRR
jgi:hypothetical protein